MDPHKVYLSHLKNQYYLEFLARHPDSSRNERVQAERELLLCAKKLAYWSRMPKFDHKLIQKEVDQLKKDWNR